MGILTIVSFIWLIANFCIFVKRNFEEVIGICFCILILMLQILAMLGGLTYIGIITTGFGMMVFIFHIYRHRLMEALQEMKKYMITFGGGVFVILCMMCIFFSYGRRVCYFDEFNFWAPAVKTLWNYQGFASGTEVWSCWEYPQGMPLLEWFGSYLFGRYAEWTFYAIRLIFNFSLILPVFKNIKAKWYLTPLAAVFTYIFPSMINTTSYLQLSVDGDLALLFGFFIYAVVDRKRFGEFYYFRIVVTASTIVLIKDFSIVFVIYGWILFVTLGFMQKKELIQECRMPERRKENVCKSFVFLAPLITMLSWSWFLKISGYMTTRVSGRVPKFLKAVLSGTWKWTGYETDLIKTFFGRFFFGRVSYSLEGRNGLLSPFFIVLCVMAIIIILERKNYINKAMRHMMILFWLFVVTTYSILLVISLCSIFVGEIATYIQPEYMNLAICRYCAPVYLGGILVCLLTASDIRFERKKAVSAAILATALVCTNYTVIKISMWPFGFSGSDEKKYHLEQLDRQFENEFFWMDDLEKGQEKVYFLGPAFDLAFHYKMIPKVVRHPDGTQMYTVDDLKSYLDDNQFKYIYYADKKNTYETLGNFCSQMLAEGEQLEIGGLYKIQMSGEKFWLERVNIK